MRLSIKLKGIFELKDYLTKKGKSMKNPTGKYIKPKYKDPQKAFKKAIKSGRLSDDPCAVNYAGWYMYMGTFNGIDQFKHSSTRQYID
jgi:hypothetical protein